MGVLNGATIQMKLVLVHGFNVKDGGTRTVDTLIPFAEVAGYEVDKDEGDYGYFNLLMIRWFKARRKRKVLFRLAKAFETADIIVTHSNGAHFTTQALNMLPSNLVTKKLVVHISPALNSNTDIPEVVKAQLVLYTPHDGWVKASSYLPLHPWGRMGARGYTGTDIRNRNLMDRGIRKHSEWFTSTYSRRTWKYVHAFAEEHKT